MIRLGVDTGGTFTDFVWLDENGRFRIFKHLSTPHDPSAAILNGVDHLQLPLQAEVVHGATVATNALLERRGARTALITTTGFADILAIGRQNRPDLYALVPQKPPPLVPRAWRFEIDERVTAAGEVLQPLNLDGLTPILQQMARDEIESVAVCLLFSYLYPTHERKIGEFLLSWARSRRERPLHVSLSVDILPEYREYERTSTTVINAYVAPLMSRYLARLSAGLGARRLTIMQSNGGVISAQMAGAQAARTALSGPAGGVVGARFVAEQAGYTDLITFDMGGTSTDVALCPGRLPATAAGEIAGMPLRLPIIDIHTVGAGGGSLAYVDAGGVLHVGPQSAGADPGPACYGRVPITSSPSATNPDAARMTVTDANLLLGRLDARHFLGGEMHLDMATARVACRPLAAAMGAATLEEAAWGVIQVANANMERAMRRISVERGHDPRRFTLLAFGGAGPLHACELARSLQIPRVLVPTAPGVLSALGMLAAAPTKDYSRTNLRRVTTWDSKLQTWLDEQFAPLAARALADMTAEGHAAAGVSLQAGLDMRYAGQSHELTIPFSLEFEDGNGVAEAFHTAHESRFGYRRDEVVLEIVTLRLTAVVAQRVPQLTRQELGKADAGTAVIGQKQVWFDRRPQQTNLLDRARLQAGMRFVGPAVVAQYDTTTVIPPGWETAVDPYGNLLLNR